MQTVRGFINFIKANPTMRDQFKSNKLAIRKEYNNEVNESEIHSSSLDQVQQLINEDKDIVFNALVAANYIDEINAQMTTTTSKSDSPRNTTQMTTITAVAEKVDIYNIDELGPTTGTVFQIFANNNLDLKIRTLFDTGAMKSVMSWKMYQQLKLNDLDTTNIPQVVGASGESLGARGRTKCEININCKVFCQSFIVCEQLKRQ